MLHIRAFLESDSISELTVLLHRAYARLGAMGLNYTAVDQTPEVTAQRIRGGNCFVAADGARLVGWVQWPGKVYRSIVLSKSLAASA